MTVTAAVTVVFMMPNEKKKEQEFIMAHDMRLWTCMKDKDYVVYRHSETMREDDK